VGRHAKRAEHPAPVNFIVCDDEDGTQAEMYAMFGLFLILPEGSFGEMRAMKSTGWISVQPRAFVLPSS
jgi:hypothetical protein